MRKRIRFEESIIFGTIYIPQYKKVFWHSYRTLDKRRVKFFSITDAYEFLKRV